MICTSVKVPGGVAIVCSSRRGKKCPCGRRATLLCDWKVKTKRSGTCDAPLCERCTTHPRAHGVTNFDKDLCAAHAAEWERRQHSVE